MSKTQKTLYIDRDKDKDLIEYIGSDNFSSSMIRLARIGVQFERLGVSDIMKGLMVARMSETDALQRALEIILENRMVAPKAPLQTLREATVKEPRHTPEKKQIAPVVEPRQEPKGHTDKVRPAFLKM